jgi:hypothetical protein
VGYSSLKNKVIWQVTSFSRDVFVERAELSATQSIPLMFAFMGYRLRFRGFSLYGMGSVKNGSQDVVFSSLTNHQDDALWHQKRGPKRSQKRSFLGV